MSNPKFINYGEGPKTAAVYAAVVVELYKDIITSDEADAAKLGDKLLQCYGLAIRQVRRAERDRAKAGANKRTK